MSIKKLKAKRRAYKNIRAYIIRSVTGAALIVVMYLAMMASTALAPSHASASFLIFALAIPSCIYGLVRLFGSKTPPGR